MKADVYKAMDDETLLECEDLMSAEISEIVRINAKVKRQLPLCVQNLIDERHKALGYEWEIAMVEIEKRNLTPLDTGEA